MLIKEAPKQNKFLFWGIILVVFSFLLYTLRPVLMPFVAGIILAYLLDPVADKLERLKINRGIASILTLIFAVLIFVPIVITICTIINSQLSSFAPLIPEYANKLVGKIALLQDQFPALQTDKIRDYLNENLSNTLRVLIKLLQKILVSSASIFNVLSLLLITPIVAFYMLRDWDKFLSKIEGLLPKKSKNNIKIQAQEINSTLASFIRGQSLVCLLLGFMYATGLYFCKLELGILVGFLAGIISFIPYVGSITGFVISILIASIQFTTIPPILCVIAVFMVGQFIEGNFLTPKLVGDSVGLHPVWVMFALLAGGVLLGFLGLLLAVPVAAIIGVLLKHLIKDYKKSSLYKG
ncbi:MAG: AI-2E family transporter [Alphaproteobacteria bacterium]